LAPSGVALATEQAQQRREGRDVKQDAKQDAPDQKNNAECRQDKRDIKTVGRRSGTSSIDATAGGRDGPA